MKRLLLLVLWLIATGAAVGVAWAGVSVVDQQVTGSEVLAPVGPAGASPSSTGVTVTTAAAEPTPTGQAPSTSTPASTSTPTTTATSVSGPPADGAITETFTLVGGTAAVSFSPTAVEVLWATSQPGYEVSIEPQGSSVEIDFRAGEHRSRLEVWWADGPQHQIRELEDDD